MINGAHMIVDSNDAEADRAFMSDTLGLVGVDAGGGWLIFKLPPAEVAVHPTDGQTHHQLYLMCDDIDSTLAELAAKGIKTAQQVSEERWGRLASIRLPGGPPCRSTSRGIQWPITLSANGGFIASTCAAAPGQASAQANSTNPSRMSA